MGFTFVCYRRLKSNLGRLDAAIECNEVAVREFILRATSSSSPDIFTSHLSKKHKIRVDRVNLQVIQTRISQLYLLSVYQQAEEFLNSFKEEHPSSSDWKHDKDSHLLERILHNIGSSFNDNKDYIGTFRLEIFDYYRLIRNRFMHPNVKNRRLDNQLQKINYSRIREVYRLREVPHRYGDLSFNDFILFSRVTKDIAYALCQLGRPSDPEIARMIQDLDKNHTHNVNLKALKRRINNPTRLRNSLFGLVKTLYGLDYNESESIVRILMLEYKEGSLA